MRGRSIQNRIDVSTFLQYQFVRDSMKYTFSYLLIPSALHETETGESGSEAAEETSQDRSRALRLAKTTTRRFHLFGIQTAGLTRGDWVSERGSQEVCWLAQGGGIPG